MRIAAYNLHSILVVLYFLIGSSSRIWGGTYMITQFLFIAILCGFVLARKRIREMERLFLKHAIGLSIAVSIYTASAINAPDNWVQILTPILGYLMAASTLIINMTSLFRFKS